MCVRYVILFRRLCFVIEEKKEENNTMSVHVIKLPWHRENVLQEVHARMAYFRVEEETRARIHAEMEMQ